MPQFLRALEQNAGQMWIKRPTRLCALPPTVIPNKENCAQMQKGYEIYGRIYPRSFYFFLNTFVGVAQAFVRPGK